VSKGVRCSWVDMAKIRQALAGGQRGDQSRLGHMRCVEPGTISKWRHACDLIEAVEDKVSISTLSSFQPSHAAEIARHFRKREKEWTQETKAEIVEWVDRCEKEELTVQQLRQVLVEQTNGAGVKGKGCTVEDLDALADSGEVFGTIYVDPPWKYGNQATRASTGNHYKTMTVDEIAALPVGKLADECCHLHLWTTNAFLFECPRLFDAWDFTYQGVFIWCKPQMGIGNCWRVSHELLLLAIRGEPRRFLDHSLMSYVVADRGQHSAKPEQVQLMIERASPGPRLELFARRERPGWTVWGDQIEQGLFSHKQEKQP
jgi:N6-adenosine-specific RNA methylase IME4